MVLLLTLVIWHYTFSISNPQGWLFTRKICRNISYGIFHLETVWGYLQDVFTNAAPVSGGIGMFLLQKMGWKQGEGLGKNNEGQKEPLMLDFKVDRKGNTCIRLCLLSHKVLVTVLERPCIPSG